MLSNPKKTASDNLEKIREKLRQDALINEFKRLRTALKKKGRIIFFQKVALSFSLILLAVLSGFIFIPHRLEISPNVPGIANNNSTFHKEASPPIASNQPSEKYYYVRFERAPEFILAIFPNLGLAIKFCEETKKMGFPNTEIIKQSPNLPIALENNLNGRPNYSIQLGAFQHYYLKAYIPFLKSLEHKHINGLHKYQLGTYSDYHTGKQIALQLKLNQFYLVENSNAKPTPPQLLEKILQPISSSENIFSHQQAGKLIKH